MHRLLIWGTLLTSLAAAQVNVSAPTQVIFPASKFTCAGPAPTVCTLYDDTPATGADTLTIRAGPAQAGINLFNIYANDGITAGLHVNSSRNVGVGTVTPITNLEVSGAGVNIGGTAFFNFASTQDHVNYRGFLMGYDSAGQIGLLAAGSGGGVNSQLAFWRTVAAGGYAETMRIDGIGQLAIGATAAAYQLDVAKGTGTTARFKDQTAVAGSTYVLMDIGAAQTGSSEMFRINGVMRFGGTNTTGAGAALLAANSPATVVAAPYTWIQALAADGTVVFIPAWK